MWFAVLPKHIWLILLAAQSSQCSYFYCYLLELFASIWALFICCLQSHWLLQILPLSVLSAINVSLLFVCYSTVTSCWHTTLWPWLHVVIQVILAILSFLVQPSLVTINNDLCYFHLQAVLKFICLPKTSIYCKLLYWWMTSCSVIRLTPSSWLSVFSNIRWIKFSFW